MPLENDQDDYGEDVLLDDPFAVQLCGDDRAQVTCLGCGEVFMAAWWDDCPVCGAPADGA